LNDVGSRSWSPGMSLKSRRFLVTSSSLCSMAVAAMSASGVRSAGPRRSRPARSAIDLSTTISRNGARNSSTRASFVRPANSSLRVMTEYEMAPAATRSGRAPRKWSMQTSVSTSTSIAKALRSLFPFVSRGDLEIRDAAEGSVKHRLDISRGGSVPGHVGVDGVADDRRERLPFALPASVELLALLLGQVDLRPSSCHIQRSIQHSPRDA
jgi:hypothetical protein